MTSQQHELAPSDAPPVFRWALALFDGTQAAHDLSDGAQRLLQLAANYLYAAGEGDADTVARRGRDLALAQPIAGLKSDEQAIVAGVVALQREKPRARREPVLLRLNSRDKKVALRLAAILQTARALAAAEGALSSAVDGKATTLAIGGKDADELAQTAAAQTGLWHEHIGPLLIRAAAPGEALLPLNGAPHEPMALITRDGAQADELTGDESIAEGARRVLRRFFGRMLAREDAVRKNDDPEDVHQMRVASRRLRAALQIVEGVYDQKAVRRYRRGLRRVAQELADVRDLDVFHEHVAAYQAKLSEAQRNEITPLLEAIVSRRAEARAALRKDLKQDHYQKFKREFADFLTTPGVKLSGDISATARVRDFAGSAIWRRYEQWRAHEVMLADPSDTDLHEARIAGKRLRYTLEFFADALGPNVEQALAPLVALQECLGGLQDSVVARQRVHDLKLDHDGGIRAYLEARDAEHTDQITKLQPLWDKVGSATYRRRLFEMIVKL
ncbi:MAG TPA: CHAD domain-containing protein [Roseiflexaceae bacterium]|nr:CHAD domain-containing protein [Roseiflexaceae bacterium]